MSGSSASAVPAAPAPKSDRYASFCGIGRAGNARQLVERIEQHTLGRGDVGPFWPYFHRRQRATSGVRRDDLLLLASVVNPIRELLESLGRRRRDGDAGATRRRVLLIPTRPRRALARRLSVRGP